MATAIDPNLLDCTNTEIKSNLREVALFLPRDAGLALSHVPAAQILGAVSGEGVEGEPLAVVVRLALLEAAVARGCGGRLDDTCVVVVAARTQDLQWEEVVQRLAT